MKINKFKKVGKNKYKIIFDNTDLTLYEDVILKYDLLIKKEVDLDLIDKIIEENKIPSHPQQLFQYNNQAAY